jgi:hypothetical protein
VNVQDDQCVHHHTEIHRNVLPDQSNKI